MNKILTTIKKIITRTATAATETTTTAIATAWETPVLLSVARIRDNPHNNKNNTNNSN